MAAGQWNSHSQQTGTVMTECQYGSTSLQSAVAALLFFSNWSHPDSKSTFSQNKTNLLSIINVATCFDSQSHHQANY